MAANTFAARALTSDQLDALKSLLRHVIDGLAAEEDGPGPVR